MTLKPTAKGLQLLVQVVPRASRVKVGPLAGERIKVSVTAPPVDGKANEAVVRAVAEALNLPRRHVVVVSGATSRRKTLLLTDVDEEQVRKKLGIDP